MKQYTITQHDREDLLHMRNIRRDTVFPIINRGKLWYDSLSPKQLEELTAWYNAWLVFTDTNIIPKSPTWLEPDIDYEVV